MRSYIGVGIRQQAFCADSRWCRCTRRAGGMREIPHSSSIQATMPINHKNRSTNKPLCRKLAKSVDALSAGPSLQLRTTSLQD